MVGAVCCAILITLTCGSAAARGRSKALSARASIPERVSAPERRSADDGYFVEFRSRPGYLFGHTYLVYGRMDSRGRRISEKYAGSYPIDGQRGLIIGSVVPVPSSVRGVKEDYEERPSNIYRRRLSPAEYARLKAVIRHVSANDRHWNLLFANCNDFAIEVAHGMGLTTPPSWVLPEVFIAGLREMNEP
jgi:hypothetical protein